MKSIVVFGTITMVAALCITVGMLAQPAATTTRAQENAPTKTSEPSTTPVATSTATISVAWTSTPTATATTQANSAARITIRKVIAQTGREGGTFDFSSEFGSFQLGAGDVFNTSNLAPGTYNVTEAAVDGWSVESITCTGSISKGRTDAENRTVLIEVGPGGVADCTFVNSQGPATRQTKVLFIQGIGSSSSCSDGFAPGLSWLTGSLVQQITSLNHDDFLYYAYRSPYTPSGTCSDGNPRYSNLDSCWTIDDTYRDRGERRVNAGQAKRLAAYLRSYLDAHPSTDFALVTHSQGGVLAAYTVKQELSAAYRQRVQALVTLDSPLGGINTLGAGLLRSEVGCANNDLRLDSAFDMKPGDNVIGRINDGFRPATRLYTVDADPGCQPWLSNRRCTRFGLIDAEHATSWWATSRLKVRSDFHSDPWIGCFLLAAGGTQCSDSLGIGLPPEGAKLARFVACAVGNLSTNCRAYANTAD